MNIIFRDDDTSYFTSPALLERVYAPVWSRGLPVCLAVIPTHQGHIPIPLNDGFYLDPNVPPQYRHVDQTFPIIENSELCKFLDDLAAQGLVEICLHGYTHRWLEAVTDDREGFEKIVDAGLSLFERAFPRAAITTFLAPYEEISAAAMEVLLARGMTISLPSYNIPEGIPQLAPQQSTQVHNGVVIAGGTPYPLTASDVWSAALNDNTPDETYICINHYWEFYGDWGEVDVLKLQQWHDWLNELLPQYADRVTTFAAVTQRFK